MSFDATVRIRVVTDTAQAFGDMNEAVARISANLARMTRAMNNISAPGGLTRAVEQLDDMASVASGAMAGAGEAAGAANGRIGTLGGTLLALSKRLLAVVGAATAVRYAFDTASMGATLDAVRAQFYALSGGAWNAERYMAQMRQATLYTVSDLDLMRNAMRLVSMGLVESADDAARFVRIAAMLGDKSKDISDRISDFVALISNRSIRRLDNFGFSVGQIRERMKELTEIYPDMTEEQAFVSAVLEQGDTTLNRMGSSVNNTKTAYDRLAAAFKNVRASVGESVADFFAPFANMLAIALEGNKAPVIEAAKYTYGETWDEYANNVYRQLLESGRAIQVDFEALAKTGAFGAQEEVLEVARGYYDMLRNNPADFLRLLMPGAERERIEATYYAQFFGFPLDTISYLREGLLDEVSFNAIKNAESISDAYTDAGVSLNKTLTIISKALSLAEEHALYYKIMTQAGQREYERQLSYDEKRAKILTDIEDTQARINRLMEGGLTEDEMAAFDELNARLQGYKGDLAALDEDRKRARAQMLYDIIEARLALDGLDTREQDFLRKLQLRLGLIDESTYRWLSEAARIADDVFAGSIEKALRMMDAWLAGRHVFNYDVMLRIGGLSVPEGYDIYRQRTGRGASAIVEESAGGSAQNVNITANFYNTPRPDDVIKSMMKMQAGRY